MTGSLRELSPGRWELCIYLGLDPFTGKPRQKSRVFRGGKREAGRELSRLVAEYADKRPTSTATVTVLFDEWLATLPRRGRSPETIRGYSQVAGNWKARLGKVELRKLTARHLDAYYAAAIDAGLAGSTIRLHHAVMSAALAQAVKWEWVDRNVAALASPPSGKGRVYDPPTVAAVRRLLVAAADSNMDLAMLIFLAMMTGARRGELCRLEWRDVDFAGSTVLFRVTKTGKPRRLSLDAATLTALEAHRQSVVGRLGRDPASDWFVFSPALGSKPWSPAAVTTWFGRVRDREGLGPIRLHDLRHFSVTQLIGAGVDPKTVADRHGHVKPSMTLDVYAGALTANDQAAADVMGQLGIEAPGSVVREETNL